MDYGGVLAIVPSLRDPGVASSPPASGRCEVQGLGATSGRPTRASLEDLGLKKVADLLQKRDKLG